MVSEEKSLKMLTGGRRTDDGWTTDAGVNGILIAHIEAFGSGELKSTKLLILIRQVFRKCEYDQEIPQSQIADNPMVPRGRVTQQSRDTRKTNYAK